MNHEEYLKRRESYRVRVFANGVWIEGDAYKYPKDYGCTLEHEGYKLSDSRHIMFMCPKKATKQDAVKFAESHLGEMYRIINLYRTKKDQLLAELQKELPQIIEEYAQRITPLHQKKIEMKQKCKAGEASQNEYQQAIREYRDEKSNCRSAMDKMREVCILRVFGEEATKVQWETMRYLTDLSRQDYAEQKV